MNFPGKRPIRLGDKTTHGGAVIAAPSRCSAGGIPIAVIGDAVSCPKCGPNAIAEGDSSWSIDGKPVALDGHATACGARLIASLPA